MRIILPSNAARPDGREPDLLDALMAIDNELVDWILHARPGDAEEKQQMRRVLALRTRLEQDINTLVLQRLRLSTAGLEVYAVRLNAVSADVFATAKAIDTVKDMLNSAEEAVTIASRVVASVVAF